MNITEHGIARGDAAGRRVGQDDDIGQARFLQPPGHHRGAWHLHQAENTFLHPRTAGGRDHDVGAVPRERLFRAFAERLADRHAHASAHEAEILHSDHCRAPLDRPRADEERIPVGAFGPSLFEPIGIALGIAKLERILLHLRNGQDFVTFVEQHGEPPVRPDPPVMVAAGADVAILAIFLREHHLLTARAFDPEILVGRALGQERDVVADAGEPVHARGL